MKESDNFKTALKNFVKKNVSNDLTLINLPCFKRGYYSSPFNSWVSLKHKIKVLFLRLHVEIFTSRYQQVFSLLDDKSKYTYIEVLGYKIMGHKKVRLSINDDDYANLLRKIESLKINIADDMFIGEPSIFNLSDIGFNIKLRRCSSITILADFFLKQYEYRNNSEIISAGIGDTVLDLGGFFGDTALYFASKVLKQGFVFSFEFVPENIKVFKDNMDLNPDLSKIIRLVELPVHKDSNLDVYYEDKAGGTFISKKQKKKSLKTKTISIDDFIKENNISKVDFIKMDIEGSEMNALCGAFYTITRFRPRLAIAIYHRIGDFTKIPLWINSLNVGYRIRIGHYSSHDEETICFAALDL